MSNITNDQVKELFRLQRNYNNAVNCMWHRQGWPFYLATLRELGEALGHLEHEWVWWKKLPAPDTGREQAWIEIIDAFHFTLCTVMLKTTPEEVADNINEGYRLSLLAAQQHSFDPAEKVMDAITDAMSIAAIPLEEGKELDPYVTAVYGVLCAGFGKTPEDIYRWYIGKNALNNFRLNNGYKSGTYSKMWNGLEDNVYLADILKECSSYESIYAALEEEYEASKVRASPESTMPGD